MLRIEKIRPIAQNVEIELPYSKSILNRLLVVSSLGGFLSTIDLEGQSNDVRILYNALKSSELYLNFEDAGTPLRLFLAYAAFINKTDVTIDAGERLRERPLRELILALESLGAEFEFLENEYQLPLKIKKGLDHDKQLVTIDASVSSQFISALLLVAPCFDKGLTVTLNGEFRSWPYVEMTLKLMQAHGIECNVNGQSIDVKHGYYKPSDVPVEADWSSAAFLYGCASMMETCSIRLPNLFMDSVQGDKACMEIFKHFGVQSTKHEKGLVLSKVQGVSQKLELDFKNIPDLFPVVLSVAIAKGCEGTFTGIKNLRDKESDRIEAMIANLSQVGAEFELSEDRMDFKSGVADGELVLFDAYNDHRIAMACSIFGFKQSIKIKGEETVSKSFPNYWKALEQLGAIVTQEISE